MPDEFHPVAALLMRAAFHPIELANAMLSSSSSTSAFSSSSPPPTTAATIAGSEPAHPSQHALPSHPSVSRQLWPPQPEMDRLSLAGASSGSGLSRHPASLPALPLLPTPLGLRPLPRLPDDLLAYIISFCPTLTLAAWSLVSFRCLELAGRVLYGKVEIKRHGGYDRLFCERVSQPISIL